ncbi:MAG: sigma-70 family RNA polymerase sigma factor, partial [Cyanobacteria bacterium P01_A01_bin.135]
MDSGKSNRNTEATTDAQLWQAIVEGQTEAFGVLYDRHASLVFGIAVSVLGNTQEAEDLTQDIFVKLMGDSPYDPQRGSLRTFLAVLTRSRAIDRLRSRQRRSRQSQRLQRDAATSPPSDLAPLDMASQQEKGQDIQEAMATLSQQQQQVLELSYYEGLTQSAIAKQLSLPLGTVKSRARRGLLRLRQAIEKRRGG